MILPQISLRKEIKKSNIGLLILKTDLKTRERVQEISPILDLHPSISNWYKDTNDIDNVMRIETCSILSEEQIVHLLSQYQIYSTPLIY